MRTVVLEEDGTLVPRAVEEPVPAEGQVRVRVEACGICGTDLHASSFGFVPPGAVLGHEFAGVVDEAGTGTAGWEAGTRVCVYPMKPLDRHDLETAMATGIGLGQHQGAYAEAVCVDRSMLWRLPEDLPLERGALVEPLAVALHALDVAQVEAADRSAVIGAGPIGAMVALALRSRGVDRVVVAERNERRRRRMADLGFETLESEGLQETVPERLGGPPRVVFECAGSPATPGIAIELVAETGIVMLVGSLAEAVSISPLVLQLKEAQLRSSFAYRPGDFDEAIELIASGRVPADELVTARAPLESAQEMFEDLRRPDTEQLKVLLVPGLAA